MGPASRSICARAGGLGDLCAAQVQALYEYGLDVHLVIPNYCIGFSTVITRSVNFIHALRTSSGSHERIAVVELFVRYCGMASLVSAYLAAVERCVISEVPFDIDTLCKLLVADRRNNSSRYAIMTISEGAVMQGCEMSLSDQL